MKPLTAEALTRFVGSFNPAADVLATVADSIGGTVTAGGLWRMFGRLTPVPGVIEWNSPSFWKAHWGESARDLDCIGEDIFGNQLVCIRETPDLLIWDHESGSLHSLQAPPDVALKAVFENGIEWIDFYENGTAKVGLERLPNLSSSSHVHWTTPLILGGAIDISNTTIVERQSHIVGHAKLWREIQALPPGSPVVLAP